MNSEIVVREHQKESGQDRLLQDETIDAKTVDWNRAWRTQLVGRGLRKRDSHFWDERAPSFAKAVAETQYSDQFLAILKPEPQWSVLDMGCGSGTLAIPISRLVSRVMAVDFSGKMLDVVRQRCVDENIHNITTLLGKWEDDWEALGICECDVAIASRSMFTDDLQSSIAKFNAIARKRVYIVAIVGDGPHDRSIFDAVGRPFVPAPDYIYYYNMLYQMGVRANVTFIEERRIRTYVSPEEAAKSMQWMFDELNSHEKEKLDAFIKGHLVFRNGTWRLSYDKLIKWAVIWWDKP